MKTKQVVAWTLIVISIFGLLWLTGKNKTSNTENGPIKAENQSKGIGEGLTTSETLYDFGIISMKDGNVNTVFRVSNLSSEDINLKSVTTSCMCTVAYVIGLDGNKKGPFGMPGHGGAVSKANEIIKAGETRDIEVVYDPNAHGPAGVGIIDRLVYLEDESGNKLQLEIKANVTP